MRKKVLWFLLWAVLLLWPASALATDGTELAIDGGRIFFSEDVSLQPGEAFEGDLGLFDGDLTVPETSTVNGDVFVVNGTASIAGRVSGDLAVIDGSLKLAETGWVLGEVFGLSGDQEVAGHVRGNLSALFGNMRLHETADVEGDLLVTPGRFSREDGARVLGEVSEFRWPTLPSIRERSTPVPRVTPPSLPQSPRLPRPEILGVRVGQFVGRTVGAVVASLVLVGMGLLIALIWPRRTRQVAECISVLPIRSFGLGLLTFLLAAGLEVLAVVVMILVILLGALLVATVILIPAGLLLILLSPLVLLPVPSALGGGVVLGWVSLAELIGRKVLAALRTGVSSQVGAVFVGLLITVPVAAILWILKPVCCSWPFIVLLTSVGLGAVFHTRFGARSCQGSHLPPKTGTPAAQPEGRQGRPFDLAQGSAVEAEALPAEAMDEETGQPDVPPARAP